MVREAITQSNTRAECWARGGDRGGRATTVDVGMPRSPSSGFLGVHTESAFCFKSKKGDSRFDYLATRSQTSARSA